jgi:hypothetical protein
MPRFCSYHFVVAGIDLTVRTRWSSDDIVAAGVVVAAAVSAVIMLKCLDLKIDLEAEKPFDRRKRDIAKLMILTREFMDGIFKRVGASQSEHVQLNSEVR